MQVWRFWEAPQELQALSEFGGDEDWVIVVPADEEGRAEELANRLVVCDYSQYTAEYGGQRVAVFITAHA